MTVKLKRIQSIIVVMALILSMTNVALAAGLSTKPDAANIVVTNNAGISDTVKVIALTAGDVVKVYNPIIAAQVGTATVASGKTETTVSIAQLGTDSGSVFVSVTSSGSLESDKVEKVYIAEATSTDPEEENITVTNKTTGTADTVKVTGLAAGDVVKVYKDGTVTTTLGTAKVAASATEATVTITQLGTAVGSVFVTVTSTGKKESARVEATYAAEAVTDEVEADVVTVTNNAGIADTVKVTGLVATDVVKVYTAATGGTAVGTATVAATKTEAIVSVAQLGASGGKIYVTVTSAGKLESARTEVTVDAEATSTDPDDDKVLAINNTGSDLVVVYGLKAGDVVKIYAASTGGTATATATVAANQSQAVITIAQLGAAGGEFYFTVTNSGKTESNRVAVTFTAE